MIKPFNLAPIFGAKSYLCIMQTANQTMDAVSTLLGYLMLNLLGISLQIHLNRYHLLMMYL